MAAEAEAIFKQIDTDASGSLDMHEMHAKLSDFGLAERQIEQIFLGTRAACAGAAACARSPTPACIARPQYSTRITMERSACKSSWRASTSSATYAMVALPTSTADRWSSGDFRSGSSTAGWPSTGR